MKRGERLRLLAVLILMGMAWGAAFPLAKIAVSTGYRPFGILVWQLIVGVAVSGAIIRLRGRPITLAPRYWGVFLGIALLGSVIPNAFSYTAAAHIPAGVLSIIIALVPLFALPLTLALGFEKASALRFAGLVLGAVAVALLIFPNKDFSGPVSPFYVFFAMGAALAYAGEGNFLTWYGDRGLDPFQILFGAGVAGLAIALPVALATGQLIMPLPPHSDADRAILAGAVINWLTYAAYVWMIGRAGPVFAAQVSYLITGFGVVWSILLLGESYAANIWLALGLMLLGVGLVQPRPARGRREEHAESALAPEPGLGKDAR